MLTASWKLILKKMFCREGADEGWQGDDYVGSTFPQAFVGIGPMVSHHQSSLTKQFLNMREILENYGAMGADFPHQATVASKLFYFTVSSGRMQIWGLSLSKGCSNDKCTLLSLEVHII